MVLALMGCGGEVPSEASPEIEAPIETPSGVELAAVEETEAAETAPGCEHPLPIYEDGAEIGRVCAAEADDDGLTILDLSVDWTPRVFDEDPSLGEIGLQPYRATYLALADERWDELPDDVEPERFLELFGISPTFRVLVERMGDRERHACHQAIDDTPLAAYTFALRGWSIPLDQQRREIAYVRYLDGLLERERARRDLESIDDLETEGVQVRAVREWRRLHTRIDALNVVQAHLRCDHLLEGEEPGTFDNRVSAALAQFQREHMVVSAGSLDEPTRARLAEDSHDGDILAVLRTLRERVIAATGLLEDGSATQSWGMVLTRDLDPPEIRFAAGRDPITEGGAPDLISPATEAAALALGFGNADGFLAFYDREDPPPFVAVRLPPLPSYHSSHMALRAEIDRGDVYFEYPYTNAGARRRQPVELRPTLTVYAATDHGEVALMRWPTTIGGWKPERSPTGGIGLRYKESPDGPVIWRDVIAAPAWLPPMSTPADELVRAVGGGRYVPQLALFGPSHRSAYGLAMVMHHRVMEGRDGTTNFIDEGVRTHGSVSYRSITGGTSHGCHRLYNHLAVRLTGFLLAHRHHVRRGSIPTLFSRDVQVGGQVVNIRLRSRGYLFALDPPVEVNVLPGRIRGAVSRAPTGFRPLQAALAAAAGAEAASTEGM